MSRYPKKKIKVKMEKTFVHPSNWYCCLTLECRQEIFKKYPHLMRTPMTAKDYLALYDAGNRDGFDFQLISIGAHHVPSRDPNYGKE